MSGRQKKQENGKEKKIFLVAAVVIIAALIMVFIFQYKKIQDTKKLVKQGVGYLTELENQDIDEISKNIKATRSSMSLELADTDESAVWEAFADAAILGDSRAVGFYYHEFVPEERVMAKGGGKITDVSEYLDQLTALNPEQIFLCYGLNDIGIGFWPVAEDYAVDYAKQVELLYEKLPDTTVYVNSILPAVGEGLNADPDYPRFGEYNEALAAMCKEKGWHYIDNTQMAKEHVDLYQADGLHVEKEFYKYWAANMLTEVEE